MKTQNFAAKSGSIYSQIGKQNSQVILQNLCIIVGQIYKNSAHYLIFISDILLAYYATKLLDELCIESQILIYLSVFIS